MSNSFLHLNYFPKHQKITQHKAVNPSLLIIGKIGRQELFVMLNSNFFLKLQLDFKFDFITNYKESNFHFKGK